MKITLGHLYPYELNLYGENGNIKALKYELEKNGIEVEIVNINKEDELNLNNIDFLYIGSGKTKNIEEIKERIKEYKFDLLKYISEGKILLATGNSVEILEILELYKTEYFHNRKVADVVATTSLCKGVIKGFQNTEYLIKSTSNILFNIDNGYGNDGTMMEGFMNNNLYATSIIGPILARNENLTKYFVDILKNKE